MLDDNVTKIKLTHPTHNKEDGGSLPIPPLQCFADDMTCVIEETEKNLVMMKMIFESFESLVILIPWLFLAILINTVMMDKQPSDTCRLYNMET